MDKPKFPDNVIYNPATGREVKRDIVRCKDCKFYNTGFRSARCNAPQVLIEIDYETGDKVRASNASERPQDVRSRRDLCGPEGRWYRPLNLWDRFLRLL